MDSRGTKAYRRGSWVNVPEVVSVNGEVQNRCNYCGMITVPIRVHGHEQCINCGTNVVPCCEGEQYEIDAYW